MIGPESTLIDVAFAACTTLDDAGTIAVLTGGSAATFYAPAAYQSGDADFVVVFSADRSAAANALARLGFSERNGAYRHPATRYVVEFPSGPLAIGADLITKYDTFIRNGERLHILLRTDSVRDRLAAFYHWADRSALSAAVAVANSRSGAALDLDLVRDWSVREGAIEKFKEFRARLI